MIILVAIRRLSLLRSLVLLLRVAPVASSPPDTAR
jgi:hypothetical protein